MRKLNPLKDLVAVFKIRNSCFEMGDSIWELSFTLRYGRGLALMHFIYTKGLSPVK